MIDEIIKNLTTIRFLHDIIEKNLFMKTEKNILIVDDEVLTTM